MNQIDKFFLNRVSYDELNRVPIQKVLNSNTEKKLFSNSQSSENKLSKNNNNEEDKDAVDTISSKNNVIIRRSQRIKNKTLCQDKTFSTIQNEFKMEIPTIFIQSKPDLNKKNEQNKLNQVKENVCNKKSLKTNLFNSTKYQQILISQSKNQNKLVNEEVINSSRTSLDSPKNAAISKNNHQKNKSKKDENTEKKDKIDNIKTKSSVFEEKNILHNQGIKSSFENVPLRRSKRIEQISISLCQGKNNSLKYKTFNKDLSIQMQKVNLCTTKMPLTTSQQNKVDKDLKLDIKSKQSNYKKQISKSLLKNKIDKENLYCKNNIKEKEKINDSSTSTERKLNSKKEEYYISSFLQQNSSLALNKYKPGKLVRFIFL